MQTAGLILLLAAGVIVLFGGGTGGATHIPVIVAPHDVLTQTPALRLK
jgi:hypothetical protein